ncbi:MAG: hypothetical protein AAF328_05990 [Planctomycetota bacterium]
MPRSISHTHARTAAREVPAVSATYAAQAAGWVVASGAAVYLMIRVGTLELSGSPWAVAGPLLIGMGLVKHAHSTR